MRFLDNFSVLEFDNIRQDNLKCDFFICCSSFEERCSRGGNLLSINKIKIENSIIFNYKEKDTTKNKVRNLERIHSNLSKVSKNIYEFDNCSVDFPSDGMKAFKNFLFEKSIDLTDKNVIIDITVFTKPYLFILIKLLSEEFSINNFFVIYTEPGNYGIRNSTEYDLSTGLFHISHISGFHGHSLNTNDALIVLLGFEGNRSLSIFYNINPDVTYAVNGFPAFQPGWHKKSIELNKRFLMESGANFHLFNAPANDPFETKRILKKVVDENITKCYIDKVASERQTSSLKTERNKQRETSIFIFRC